MTDVRLLRPEPVGIGGWLVLPLIGLILWPLSLLYRRGRCAAVLSLVLFLQRRSPARAGRRTPPGALLRSLVAPAIWIPYFWQSVRVRNTFVR